MTRETNKREMDIGAKFLIFSACLIAMMLVMMLMPRSPRDERPTVHSPGENAEQKLSDEKLWLIRGQYTKIPDRSAQYAGVECDVHSAFGWGKWFTTHLIFKPGTSGEDMAAAANEFWSTARDPMLPECKDLMPATTKKLAARVPEYSNSERIEEGNWTIRIAFHSDPASWPGKPVVSMRCELVNDR